MQRLLLSFLGLVYLSAFLGLCFQLEPLLGSQGITPLTRYLAALRAEGLGFWEAPSLFWLDDSDATLRGCALLGALLSLVVLAGFGNAPVLLLLWLLYGSFVHTGQHWFGFGWEIQLLETGFLAVFFAPPLDPRGFRGGPPRVTVLLLRWLTFRIMLGAGLIKLRGDPCWLDLTCLDTHFETQPIPNPLSPWFHRLPHGVLAAGVAFNHLVEVILPWGVFGPRRLRLTAGLCMLLFQGVLILSGNLAFLNWLTIVPILACFDDAALLALVPRALRARLEQRLESQAGSDSAREVSHTVRLRGVLTMLYALTVAWLSMAVVENLASPRQAMNRSFDALALVNTYGAFGSVGSERDELIIEGTTDATPGPHSQWLAYELPCKPGELARRPCVLGPYHLRLDWLIWFAAMRERGTDVPWMVHVVWKLLHGDPVIEPLFAVNPFAGTAPRFVRVRRFRYQFAERGERAWWTRERERVWLPPLGKDHPGLRSYLIDHGFLPPSARSR